MKRYTRSIEILVNEKMESDDNLILGMNDPKIHELISVLTEIFNNGIEICS